MSGRRIPATLSAVLSGVLLFAAGGHYGVSRCQSQSVPDFRGTWELINYNGRKKRASNERFPMMTLIIMEEASEIRITRKRIKLGKEEVASYLYNTDGGGETNVGRVWQWPEAPNLESVTTRRQDKLMTEYKKIWFMGAFVPMFKTGGYSKDEWQLGSDGKTLSLITRSWSVSRWDSSLSRSKLVFRRIS